MEIYIILNVNDNRYNIESNFINNDLYTNTTIPLDIYGYLRNLSSTKTLIIEYHKNLTDYNIIKTEYLDIIKKTIEECIISNNNSYSLLVNKPNFNDQNYWTIPNELKTDIYNVSQHKLKSDYMVETTQQYNELLNIKYLELDNIVKYGLYPIYSVQVEEGNYTIDVLLEKMEDIEAIGELLIQKVAQIEKFQVILYWLLMKVIIFTMMEELIGLYM